MERWRQREGGGGLGMEMRGEREGVGNDKVVRGKKE